MFFTFKWMDNLQQIEHHQKIKNCLLFFIFNFTCCKFFSLKENHYSKQTTTLTLFFMGRSGYPTKRGNWGGGGSPCKSKSLNFPLLLDKNITYWEIPHISNSFQIRFNKILPAACIQLDCYDLFEKAELKLSPLIQNTVQQDYLPESYASHLPSYQKCHKIVAPTRCGLFPVPLNLYGKPWGWGKILLNIQKVTPFPHQKTPP